MKNKERAFCKFGKPLKDLMCFMVKMPNLG